MTLVLYPLYIGYPRFSDLTLSIDYTRPVYVAPIVEAKHGTVEGQRVDHHYIVVSQPDMLNHVHYCRVLVTKVTLLNGIPFALNYEEQLSQVERVRQQIEHNLVGEGLIVRVGVVAIPEGLKLEETSFEEFLD